jgi:hypothetical protein
LFGLSTVLSNFGDGEMGTSPKFIVRGCERSGRKTVGLLASTQTLESYCLLLVPELVAEDAERSRRRDASARRRARRRTACVYFLVLVGFLAAVFLVVFEAGVSRV